MEVASGSFKEAELLNDYAKVVVGKRRFLAAIEAYTGAITLCPNVAKYYTNRAICHRKLKQWAMVEEDCRKALELDNKYSKAHYMLGLALVEMEDYAGGIKQLEKALNLEECINPGSDKVIEIHELLARAKYNEWELLACDRGWKLQNLKESCEKALREYHFLHDCEDDCGSKDTENDLVGELELLEEVFSKTASVDRPTEVPDYLCCKITLEIFQDPVITPSGFTYERAMIIRHLEKVGDFDPITRRPLQQHQLVPNLAMKAAVQAYLDEHPWAYNSTWQS